MHQRLAKVDPDSAVRIHPNDPQRIQRALEVYELTGSSLTQLHKNAQTVPFPYRAAKIVVAPARRTVLHERIEKRFNLMIEKGMVDEVQALRERGDLCLDTPSMRAVGYRQVWQYLDGSLDFDEMLYKGIVATRQFAKRQFTWLRSEVGAYWVDGESPELVPMVLKYLKSTLDLDT